MTLLFADTSDAYTEPDDIGKERAHEIYQYYRPPQDGESESPSFPHPDSVLQSHAQLAAIRVGVQRAIIVLADRDTSYFVAEATRTSDLEDPGRFEHPYDAL